MFGLVLGVLVFGFGYLVCSLRLLGLVNTVVFGLLIVVTIAVSVVL